MIALLAIVLAQTPTTANLPATGIAIDVLRPSFRGSVDRSLISAAAYLSGRAPIGRAHLLFEVPFAHQDTEFSGSSTMVGNPYVGIELAAATGVSAALGVRLPAVGQEDEASELGLYADLSRAAAFVPDIATLQGLIRYRTQSAEGYTVDISGGPALWLATEEGDDTQVVLHHQLSAGYRGRSVWVAAGISGLSLLSESNDDRTVLELNASLGATRGGVRPAIHFILPISEDYRSTVSYVLGFGVAFTRDN